MIQYKVDKEQKHIDDLVLHLRAHNDSFTGPKVKESAYIYVLKNDVLLGGASVSLSWDWVGIQSYFYKDEEVLEEILGKICEMFNEKAVGVHKYTKDFEQAKVLKTLGFDEIGQLEMSPSRGLTYALELRDLNIKRTHKFHTISSKDIVNEYDIIMKEHHQKYKEKYNIKGVLEEIHYMSYDEDKYVGGIYLQLYEDSMYVDLLAVNPDYKGKGVGTKLMNYAEEVAREKGFVSIDLGTAEFQARPFYEKLGYKVVLINENQPKGFRCYTLMKHLN